MDKDFPIDLVGLRDPDFDLQVEGLGFNTTGYPGAFTPTVNRIILQILATVKSPKVLHLFSGVSQIGDVRIDIHTPEATDRQDVIDFIRTDKRYWDFVLLDPPYEIKRKSKLEAYGRTSSVAADVQLRRALVGYFADHAANVIWLDMCAPLPKHFRRVKLWLLFPGGYHTPRILSWLTIEKSSLEIAEQIKTNPASSNWLKTQIMSADSRDILDALGDAETFVKYLQKLWEEKQASGD